MIRDRFESYSKRSRTNRCSLVDHVEALTITTIAVRSKRGSDDQRSETKARSGSGATAVEHGAPPQSAECKSLDFKTVISMGDWPAELIARVRLATEDAL